MVDMTPQVGDYSIQIPITFDYKGGRGENSKKNNIILGVVFGVLFIATIVVFLLINGLEWWQKILYILAASYIWLVIARFIGFNEIYYSDIYETLLERDFTLYTEDMWQIFNIDVTYPYVCYFKNGMKGIFVNMVRDAITGKPESAVFDHYNAIANAYNMAHSLNMNIVHVDYMDTVGNDTRLQTMKQEANSIANPKMKDIIQSIYINLENEMGNNYASHDIYLYLTRDDKSSFLYNVQRVSNVMCGGNFISYTIMDRDDINTMVKGVFNIHDFSILKACHRLIEGELLPGIRPISVIHGDGTVETINKTTAEEERDREMELRRLQDEQNEKLERRHKARKEAREAKKNKKMGKNEPTTQDNNIDSLDLF